MGYQDGHERLQIIQVAVTSDHLIDGLLHLPVPHVGLHALFELSAHGKVNQQAFCAAQTDGAQRII